MAIKDLQVRQGNIDIVVEVTEKGDVREFEKFGRKGRVCSAKAKDASGEIILTLWNEQIDQVNVGDTVHITNGYVSEFQGEPQLTTGKLGRLEIVKASEKVKEEPKEEKKEPTYTNVPPEKLQEELPEKPFTEEEDIEE